MSTSAGASPSFSQRMLARLDDRLNPLMVKEIHQGFRNGTFVMVGLVVLLIPLCWFFSVTAASSFVPSSFTDDSEGASFFSAIVWVLGIFGSMLLPVRAAIQLHGEVKNQTIDLIALTGMSSWQLAVGRFQAAALQLLLLLSFVSPFAAASVTMGGIGVMSIATALAFMLLLGFVQCSLGLLTASTMLLSPRLGTLAIVLFALQTMLLTSTAIAVATFGGVSSAPTEILPWLSACLLAITLFALRVSADVLAPRWQRSFFASRLTLLVPIAVILLPLWSGYPAMSGTRSDSELVLFAALWPLYFFGLLWSAPKRDLSSSRTRWSLIFGDGAEPNLVYAGLLSAAFCGLAQWRGVALAPVIVSYAYFVCLVGLATLAHGFLPARKQSGEAYVWILLGLVFLEIGLHVFAESTRYASVPREPIAEILVPLTLGDSQLERNLPWFSLLALAGALSLWLARARRAKRAHA